VTPVDQDGSTRFAWRTGDLLIHADRRQGVVTALSARDGAMRWAYQLPARPQTDPIDERICSRSEATGGLIALTYPRGTRDGDCSGLVLLDVATGKPRWNLVRPNRIQSIGLAITGGRLVVADLDLAGLDLRTGAVRWSHRERDLGCGIANVMATARTVAATASCGPTGRREAWTLDPVTGRALTKVALEPTPAKPTMALAELKSAEPLVVALSVVNVRAMRSAAQLTTLAAGNRSVQSTIELPKTEGAIVADDSAAMAISGHRMVLPGQNGRLTGWDLRAGKLLWVKDKIAPDGAASQLTLTELLIAGADSSGVYGVAVGHTEPGAGVFRVDPATGAITMISPVLDVSLIGRSGDTQLFWSDGLYGVNGEPGHPVAFALR
jgi:outer membrane protein assembly factor BamB